MFSKSVVRTDAFLDMPLSTQALYFHLGLEADDDGFVSSPKQVQRSIGASPDDFKVLVVKGFIIPFESGVCVIRDWKVNNTLRGDRYKPTQYLREKSQIEILPNKVYQLNSVACLPLGIPTVNHAVDEVDTQYRVEENRVVKGSAEGADKPSAVTTPAGVGDEEKPKRAKKQREPFGHNSNPYIFAKYLSDKIQERKRSGKPANETTLQNWAADFDKCNRLDGHPWKEISVVLGWCQEDGWWQDNILSGSKFRKQYDQLLMKATKAGVFHK